ncbi:hypothetical protein Val02_75460 [Virgisporangium aliadipatigenens]|uniref:Lycopene cyclase domain-containing protein n=1 Tax=Virgisporangium aliadipatigenens TaxID=741659 RepID=A0A8J3YVP2_9ACTN|nr:hypothetical protein [Virgisporangium aliadipatigenens]GIJ50660.1 hypothetical protein Val02_75460 [Virgisporangium aliadipatigenens]
MLAYWIIVAAPVLVVAGLSLWPLFRRHYWERTGSWLPGMLLGAALLAVDGVFSAAAGFWEFTDLRFPPSRFLGLPPAEWPFFFAGAVFGVRLVWVLAGFFRGVVDARAFWGVVAVLSVAYGLVWWDRPRTVYVCALALPLAVGLALSTVEFRRWETQAFFAIGFLLFLPMDILMNGMGSFAHDEAMKSPWELPYGTPVEDLPYIMVVLVVLRFLPVLVASRRVENGG